jgi:predicted nucleic acid-binding protein
MIVVSDTSPVSSLLIIGEIELLEKLFGEVIVPSEVDTELRRSFSNLPSFLRIERVQNVSQVAAFRQLVGALGVLLLAKEKGFINAIRPLIDRLKREASVFLSDEIINAVLTAVGE